MELHWKTLWLGRDKTFALAAFVAQRVEISPVNPCLSVVMPAYNEAKTLAEVVAAVLAQDCVAELIIVDDASSDEIAIDHALALKFTPAYDGLGHPMRTMIVYPVEWPSYWWMIAMGMGTAYKMPHAQHVLHVPCRGSGPLHLDSVHPVYRDCTAPDMSRVEQELWYSAPARKIAGTR